MMKRIYFFLLLSLTCLGVQAQNYVYITDAGSGTGTTTWTSNNVYVLKGFVFVNSGQTLTIEPGTIIKGAPGTGANASALVVARGGKIDAQGTADNPIIFTAYSDSVAVNWDIPAANARGLWGGVIILGNAMLNSTPGETQIEGIPQTEPRGLYGGNNDADSSGIFSYVSIRHGGSDIGAGNEINGLTLGAVGSKTVIDHVEIFYNQDDGIEFFGGVPQIKYAVVGYCGDDAIDYDEGFRGKMQYVFVVADSTDGDRGGEHDGGTSPEDGSPYATPTFYNVTYLGGGQSFGKRLLTFRDNAGGYYYNSVFQGFGKGADVEILSSGEHSYARFVAGQLKLENNLFWDIAGNDTMKMFTVSVGTGVSAMDSTNASNALKTYWTTGMNGSADPGLQGIGRSWWIEQLDPRPSAAGPAIGGAMNTPSDTWFDATTFKGAFSPDLNDFWAGRWTALAHYQILANNVATGIEAQVADELNGVTVYPNPNNGQFTISIENAETSPVTVNVTDLNGRVVFNNTFSANGSFNQSVNMNAAAGMYIVTVEQSGKMKHVKLNIQ